jgi:hypothetical protein
MYPTYPSQELARIIEELAISDETTMQVLAELLFHINEYYPDGALRRYHEPQAAVMARLPMALGSNPIRLTQVYRQPGHDCYVSFFLGPLLGYELTFRVATLPAEAPPRLLSLAELKAQRQAPLPAHDFVNLLANLANHTLFTRQHFDEQRYTLHHLGGWFGNSIVALLLLPDPILGFVLTSAGTVKYIHALGISQATYDSLTSGPDAQLDQERAAGFVRAQLISNPYLITRDE